MTELHPAVTLSRELIRRPSVTPEDGGCQALIAARLAPLGFRCERFDVDGVSNSWLRRGESGPLLAFAGHTDVVPCGPLASWRHPPFEGVIADGLLHGRGAADMKSGVAAMTVALEQFVRAAPAAPGSLALLLTSDEEGPATHGTRAVIEQLQARGESIDWCIVGEPSSSATLGDTLRVGRRGSLSAAVTIHGTQGHVAYPALADNPIHRAAAFVAALAAECWDEGDADFPPTGCQVSNIAAGTGADNVIPGELRLRLNFRFGTASSEQTLRARTEALLERCAPRHEIDWRCSAQAFITPPGTLIAAAEAAIRARCGRAPQRSTGGGTSDARFIAPTGAQVVELGVCNTTIHQVDERIECEQITQCCSLYRDIIKRLLLPAHP